VLFFVLDKIEYRIRRVSILACDRLAWLAFVESKESLIQHESATPERDFRKLRGFSALGSS